MPRKGKGAAEATTCTARREIILAAGAPHSPQVLQLSGIGPKKLLSGLGIETLVDLPGVGRNFQDQPAMFIQFTCKPYCSPTVNPTLAYHFYRTVNRERLPFPITRLDGRQRDMG